MQLDDSLFAQAVKELVELATRGASLSELLALTKLRAGNGNTVLACAMFYRAFDLPMEVVTSLGAWSGFEAEFGRSGQTADELETEYGEVIRTCVRRFAK